MASTVSEAPFAKTNEFPSPVAAVIEFLGSGEFSSPQCSLFPGTASPTPEEEHEDEGASQSHEQNLPPG